MTAQNTRQCVAKEHEENRKEKLMEEFKFLCVPSCGNVLTPVIEFSRNFRKLSTLFFSQIPEINSPLLYFFVEKRWCWLISPCEGRHKAID